MLKKIFLCIILICIFVTFLYVYRESHDKNSFVSYYTVSGKSMEPLYHDGRQVGVVSYRSYREIERGDIIVYDYSIGQKNNLIKRVVALPGDRIRYEGRSIFVNDILLTNSENIPYSFSSPLLTLAIREYLIVPPDTILIFGNIPTGSLDSSHIGFVGMDGVVGKVQIQ